MKLVNLAGLAVMLNLLFLLACLPVVTLGPALCGLYSGVRHMIRGDGPARGFWKGFKTRFFRMAVTGLVFGAILAYFVIILNSAYNTWLEQGVFRDLVIHGIFALNLAKKGKKDEHSQKKWGGIFNFPLQVGKYTL